MKIDHEEVKRYIDSLDGLLCGNELALGQLRSLRDFLQRLLDSKAKKEKQPRWVFTYTEDNMPDRNAKRIEVGLGKATRAIAEMLDGEEVWDDAKASEFRVKHDGAEPHYEDALRPALGYLLEREEWQDAEAMLAAMKVGESIELTIENGKVELYRDR